MEKLRESPDYAKSADDLQKIKGARYGEAPAATHFRQRKGLGDGIIKLKDLIKEAKTVSQLKKDGQVYWQKRPDEVKKMINRLESEDIIKQTTKGIGFTIYHGIVRIYAIVKGNDVKVYDNKSSFNKDLKKL